jgi:hypothetical protein
MIWSPLQPEAAGLLPGSPPHDRVPRLQLLEFDAFPDGHQQGNSSASSNRSNKSVIGQDKSSARATYRTLVINQIDSDLFRTVPTLLLRTFACAAHKA